MARTSELDLEKRARALVGQRLVSVAYQRATWAPAPWLILDQPDIHSVGLAVYLETSGGARHRVRWADELGLRHGYGVSVAPIKVPDRDAGPLQDATGDPRWSPLLTSPIAATRFHWRDIYDSLRSSLSIGVSICADHLSRQDYPQSLELAFEDGQQVFFSAAALGPAGEPILFTNDLLVLFGPEAHHRLG